jgi:hypothetical protein
MNKQTYVAFLDYGMSGKGTPFYCGPDLLEMLRQIPHQGASFVVQVWEDGKMIEEVST